MVRLHVRGSINVDEFFAVPHIVTPGETLSSTNFYRKPGGKGANLSVAVARSGSNALMAGWIGEDGVWVREYLQLKGVHVESVGIDSNLPTGRAIIQLTPEGENCILLFPGANYSSTPPPASTANYDFLLLQNEIPLEQSLAALASRPAGCKVAFNPSPMLNNAHISTFPWSELEWLIVNEGEALSLLDGLSDSVVSREMPKEETIVQLKRATKARGIVMTLGSKGCMALYENEKVIVTGAGKLLGSVKDTTGAGDCFAGFFLGRTSSLDVITHESLSQALLYAGQAAAICCEKEGAMESYPTSEEVLERMK